MLLNLIPTLLQRRRKCSAVALFRVERLGSVKKKGKNPLNKDGRFHQL
jgi:hypothetical protein